MLRRVEQDSLCHRNRRRGVEIALLRSGLVPHRVRQELSRWRLGDPVTYRIRGTGCARSF